MARLSRRSAAAQSVFPDPATDLGVLFVATTGDDTTAVKGDLFLPWRTLDGAMTAAVAGEYVYVFGGNYTNWTVWTANVTVHFEDSLFNSVNISLPESGIYRCTGTLFSAAIVIAINGIDSLQFQWESDSAISNFLIRDSLNIVAAVRTKIGKPFLDIQSTGDPCDNLDILIEHDYTVTAVYAYLRLLLNDPGGNAMENSRIRMRFNFASLSVQDVGGSDIRGIEFSNNVWFQNNELDISFGQVSIDGEAGATQNFGLFGINMDDSEFQTAERNRFTFHCDNCVIRANNLVGVLGGTTLRLQNCDATLTGNYFFEGGACLLNGVKDAGQGALANINVSVRAFSDTPIVNYNIGTAPAFPIENCRLQGYYMVSGAVAAIDLNGVDTAGGRRLILDGVISNDGSVAALQSAVACIVDVGAAYQDSGVLVDADVTINQLFQYGGGGGGLLTASEGLEAVGTDVQLGSAIAATKSPITIIGDGANLFGINTMFQIALEALDQMNLSAPAGTGVISLAALNAILLGTGGNTINFFTGVGSPEGVVTASPGGMYLNVSGGAGITLFIKETGAATNTGWVAK